MKCRVCGGNLQSVITDLPFKTSDRTIVIVKALPVLQCSGCSEYAMTDDVFARVEELLSTADSAAELEVIRYAA